MYPHRREIKQVKTLKLFSYHSHASITKIKMQVTSRVSAYSSIRLFFLCGFSTCSCKCYSVTCSICLHYIAKMQILWRARKWGQSACDAASKETQCQARAHRCSNGLGCVEAGHAAHREHHSDTRMMFVSCGVEYRAHLEGLLHLLERGLRRLSPGHCKTRTEVLYPGTQTNVMSGMWRVDYHRPPRSGNVHSGCRHQRIRNV
jgi:hypothetical protein